MKDTEIRASIDVPLDPAAAFDILVGEVAAALPRLGLRLEPGPDGRVVQGTLEVGRIHAWEPGRRIVLRWRPASWQPDATTEVELRLESTDDGSRVTLEHRGWTDELVGGDLAGWFAFQVIGPLLSAAAPEALGDWLTDRQARRPGGAWARGFYADPLYHYPNFGVILAELALTPDDYLIEIGCGGGAMLRRALDSGCRAAAIDHSPEMVRLARELNHEAVAAGRLEVVEGTADRLPFADGTFSCATMTGVLGFLSDLVAASSEIRRVLRSGGRLVALGSDPAWRGTPAAPEPMASRLHFYEDDELEDLARAAGFVQARVVRRDLEPYAREAGVPEEHLPLFTGPGAPFLLARTD